MQTVDANTIKRNGSARSLRAYSNHIFRYSLMGAALLLGGCSAADQAAPVVTSIPPGLYIGDRECSSTVNGVESMTTDSIRFTIDNNGLLVLHGDTIHVGLANDFETGAFSQRSVIEAIAVSSDGFTIDWDTTLFVNGVSLTGFVLESFKHLGVNNMEFRSTTVVSTQGQSVTSECVAVLSR